MEKHRRKCKWYRISLIEGEVKSFSAVMRYSVQITLKDDKSFYELFLDQSWALDKNDKICLIASEPDETGKICCYGYKNYTKGIVGWKSGFSNSRALPLIAAATLWYFFSLLVLASLGNGLVVAGVISLPFAAFVGVWLDRNYNGLRHYKLIAQSK